jgi:hypothetical protein
MRRQVIALALDELELSAREVAVAFADRQRCHIPEASAPSRHVDPAGVTIKAVLPDIDLAKGSINVYSDNPAHM